ncbi:MAG: hypothetical protein V1658_00120, partial [Candidatus Micrarchaeota archaeon]
VLHYPTLKTVLAVEEVLKEAKEPLSRYAITKRMGNKVMRQTLDVTLEYLTSRGMAMDTEKGVIWTYLPRKQMEAKIAAGREL